MPPRGGISHIRAGLGVRKPATEAGFRSTVSEDDILVSRFLERARSLPAAELVINPEEAARVRVISQNRRHGSSPPLEPRPADPGQT